VSYAAGLREIFIVAATVAALGAVAALVMVRGSDLHYATAPAVPDGADLEQPL
jgi:hypothetical protein